MPSRCTGPARADGSLPQFSPHLFSEVSHSSCFVFFCTLARGIEVLSRGRRPGYTNTAGTSSKQETVHVN